MSASVYVKENVYYFPKVKKKMYPTRKTNESCLNDGDRFSGSFFNISPGSKFIHCKQKQLQKPGESRSVVTTRWQDDRDIGVPFDAGVKSFPFSSDLLWRRFPKGKVDRK